MNGHTKLHSKIVPVSLRRSKSNRIDSNYHDRTQLLGIRPNWDTEELIENWTLLPTSYLAPIP